jgi:hypothetical protein
MMVFMTTRGDGFAATVDSGANKTVKDDVLGATMAAPVTGPVSDRLVRELAAVTGKPL